MQVFRLTQGPIGIKWEAELVPTVSFFPVVLQDDLLPSVGICLQQEYKITLPFSCLHFHFPGSPSLSRPY